MLDAKRLLPMCSMIETVNVDQKPAGLLWNGWHNKKEMVMCKNKSATPRLAMATCLSAVLGLSALLFATPSAQAQCSGQLASGVFYTPFSGPVHINDTINVTLVDFGNTALGIASTNIDLYYLGIDGTTNHVATAGTVRA